MEIGVVVHIAITIISLAFVFGKNYQSLKSRPTSQKVQEMIDESFSNHCPFSDDMITLKSWKSKREVEIAAEKMVLEKKLDTIIIHVKQVCKELKINWENPEL